MSDEEKNVENQEDLSTKDPSPTDDGETEDQEDPENENQEDDNQDASDEESKDDTDDVDDNDDVEHWDSEEEFLDQYKLPGKPKTLEELVTQHQESVSKLNELQRQKADEKSKPIDTPVEKGKSYFGDNFVGKTIDEAVKNGSIKEEDSANIRAWSKTIDDSFNPVFSKIETVLDGYANVINQLVNAQKESVWNNFEHKKSVGKEEFFKYLGVNTLDPDEAFRALILKERPELINQLANSSFNKGREEGKKKRHKRFTSNRRGKPNKISSNKAAYKNYVRNGELDERRLSGLKSDKKLEVVNAFLADQEAAMKK